MLEGRKEGEREAEWWLRVRLAWNALRLLVRIVCFSLCPPCAAPRTPKPKDRELEKVRARHPEEKTTLLFLFEQATKRGPCLYASVWRPGV